MSSCFVDLTCVTIAGALVTFLGDLGEDFVFFGDVRFAGAANSSSSELDRIVSTMSLVFLVDFGGARDRGFLAGIGSSSSDMSDAFTNFSLLFAVLYVNKKILISLSMYKVRCVLTYQKEIFPATGDCFENHYSILSHFSSALSKDDYNFHRTLKQPLG